MRRGPSTVILLERRTSSEIFSKLWSKTHFYARVVLFPGRRSAYCWHSTIPSCFSGFSTIWLFPVHYQRLSLLGYSCDDTNTAINHRLSRSSLSARAASSTCAKQTKRVETQVRMERKRVICAGRNETTTPAPVVIKWHREKIICSFSHNSEGDTVTSLVSYTLVLPSVSPRPRTVCQYPILRRPSKKWNFLKRSWSILYQKNTALVLPRCDCVVKEEIIKTTNPWSAVVTESTERKYTTIH